jgi:hypothetical protein
MFIKMQEALALLNGIILSQAMSDHKKSMITVH